MQSLQQFTAIEQDALKRIHALADEEGRRRFHEAAEQWRFPLGDYDGKLCATTADVARAFGVSRQAVVKLLADANGDLPGAPRRSAARTSGDSATSSCRVAPPASPSSSGRASCSARTAAARTLPPRSSRT